MGKLDKLCFCFGTEIWYGQLKINKQGDCLTGPPPVQYLNIKILWSPPLLLFHEILHQKEPLVGSLALFHFGTERGEGGRAVKKITLYIWFVEITSLPASVDFIIVLVD